MKTIICPEYLNTPLTLKLMQQNNTNQLNDYKFMSLHGFLMSKFKNYDISTLYLAYKIRQTNVKFFHDMLKYPSFINEIINFVKLIKAFDIKLENLPQNDYKQKELYSLVLSIYDENFFENNYKNLNKLTNINDIYLYPCFTSPVEEMIYQTLLNNGAKLLIFDEHTTTSTLYKALNSRHEVESIAQDIIKNKYNLKDINIICSNTNYYDVISAVFSRYNIPYYFTNYNIKDTACIKYYYLLKLNLCFSIENLILALKNNAFNKSINQSYITYITNYVTDINDLFKPFNYFNKIELSSIDKREVKKLIKLENDANKFNIINELTLIYNSPLNEAITLLYDLIKGEDTFNLKHLIEYNYKDINEHTINDFLSLLLSQTIPYKNKCHGIIITDIFNPILPNKVSYILGLDQKNYPGYRAYNGYFNEDYVALTPIINSDERYKLHMNNLEWIFTSGNIINLSYSIASIDGKAIDVSYYIESRFNKAITYPIIQNDNNTKEIHSLNAEMAYKAFVQDNHIKGSISSFEKYFNCPYSYFLNYGLKLYDKELIAIQPNTFGTIAHSIMESLANIYHKEYAYINEEELKNLIHPMFNDLRLIFKNKTLEINSMEERLTKQLDTTLIFLKNMEKATPFSPTYLEDYFEVIIASYKNTSILINGIIDRIDTFENQLRIIDYKSSKKTLEQKKVLSGLQLQLLTYTYIAATKYNLAPAGSYYCALNVPNISMNQYDFKSTMGIFKNDTNAFNLFIKEHKLNGYTYIEDCNNLDDGNHIASLRINKDDDVVCYGGPYDYEQVRKLIHDLYNNLLNELLAGHIPVAPKQGACTYCKYNRICRFHGKELEPTPLVNYALKKGKEKDEVESITA